METQARPLVARVPTCKLSPELKPIVDEAAKDFEIIVTNPGEINKQLAQRVEGLVKYSPEYLRIDANVMDLFPNLKVISNYGVGVNHIDIAAATERGIAVGNTWGILTAPIVMEVKVWNNTIRAHLMIQSQSRNSKVYHIGLIKVVRN